MTLHGGLSLRLLLLALTIVLLEAGLILLLGVTLAKRRRADRALRESESRFRTVADSAPVLIWMSGVDRLFTFFNKPWLDFTGRTAEQEMGNGWAQGVHPGDLEGCLTSYVEACDARRPFVLQYRLRRHDGEYRWISDNGVPRYDAHGGFAGYIGSCVDITDRLRAEAETQRLRQELAHISRLATMREMTATIAHELSQPLTAIMTNAQAGLRFIGSPDRSRAEVSEIFNDIVVADQRARQVIQNMRALFQKGDAQRHPLRLNALINDVATVVGTDALLKNVSITLDLAPQLPLVSGDRVQLQQVVLNLVANAFEAVSDADQPRNVLLRTRTRGPNAVQVDVVDTGPGIAVDALASIFEPFVTTKRSGMGMGLSVSRSIVDAHDGRIWAENNADGGASFHLVLPAISAGEAG
jgi:PAS domain S-box-containing protein